MYVGIDSLDIDQVTNFINNPLHLEKKFTISEIKYINKVTNENLKLARIAGMFCAKESFLKALQIGIGAGIELNQIEINHNEMGAPYIELLGTAKQQINKFNISEIKISITHTKTSATAICICY